MRDTSGLALAYVSHRQQLKRFYQRLPPLRVYGVPEGPQDHSSLSINMHHNDILGGVKAVEYLDFAHFIRSIDKI